MAQQVVLERSNVERKEQGYWPKFLNLCLYETTNSQSFMQKLITDSGKGEFDKESKAAQSYDSVALNIGDRLPPQTSRYVAYKSEQKEIIHEICNVIPTVFNMH
ncbi:hypothetical protein Tco_0391258 [Tanacetum coccineum]